MPVPSLQQQFIDDELLRAPLALDGVVDAVLARWRLRPPPHARADGDPARALFLHRSDLVAAALQSLRASAQAELQGLEPPSPAMPLPARQTLSLIDEGDVAVDIEIAHCIQAARQTAEAELRELQTYTSALVDDLHVARDTNPFRPERFVRALWAGLQRVPLSRPVLTTFLHEAALPLAQALRLAYASACRRLEAQGVTPASHRTIVHGYGTAWGRELARYRPPTDLHGLHDSLSAPPPRRDGSAAAGAATPAASADPRLIELLARLFQEIQADRTLDASTLDLLQRLQPTVLRLALHDATPLDTYDHPVWRFMDQLAFDLTCSAPAGRVRLLGLCRNLVEHLGSAEPPEGSHFSWAIVRLAAARRHALAQALVAAGPQIDRLERLGERADGSAVLPLDIGSLDTVPAGLLPEAAAATEQAVALARLTQPGTVLRIWLQGEWRQLLCLWEDEARTLLLLAELAADRLWALRQPALARLAAEGLARPMQARSLVRRAADKALHGL